MAMAKNLLDGQKSEWSLLRRHSSENLFGLQVAVSHADQAAWLGDVLEGSGLSFDFVDINAGCPVDSICSRGVGTALLDKPARTAALCRSLSEHVSRPITLKVRTGRDANKPFIHKWAPEVHGWGLSAWTIHGRSRQQRYSKLADWDYINECAGAASIPTIGGGDVFQWEEYYSRVEHHNVVGAMIARGALIKPWIFTEIKERRVWDISATERLDMMREFCNNGMDHWGTDEKGLVNTRRFLLEWLSFTCRYVPAGILEAQQKINERPPMYYGRSELETLMASTQSNDWIKISEMILGPTPDDFVFQPKHKSSSFASIKG
eukprot:NODE_870_length_1401_cov_46.540680_g725_i0.p1 GENE.NODE_870_length_1401_cov_46.540680_g725_i0~~NODE_870_length_1401_cov_46.540680_g725_i0.p1  ORF type:complete len:320 (-),score=77.71 NODE_870_length_1401_cov_46.540680_g725_i0:38-997(-)